MSLGIVIGLMWIGACVGAVLIWPIAYSFGAQHQSDDFTDQMRFLRDARDGRRDAL